MHKKNIVLLCLLAAVTFANCLLNGFVGDDEFLFIKNPYYHSLSNLPKIVSKDYIADQDAIFNDVVERINSGSVGYRPVLSTTYFLDYALWKDKAFGYHLQNVLIHVVNTILVYLIFFAVMKDGLAAFIGAMLFSLHPLRSEAVASIGYRADSLAALFLLSSFLSYVKGRRIAAHLFFFFALFSKESAVVYPGVLMAYDWLVGNRRIAQVLKDIFAKYFGFIAILAFYLFIYVMVFPNSSLGPDMAKPLVVTGFARAVTILHIFSHYLTVFAFPFLVKSLPPLYVPIVDPLFGPSTWMAFFAVAVFIWVLITCRHQRVILFFLLWFLLFFIPVSNLIVIANPMAYRFLYLPTVGLAGAAALLLVRLRERAVFQRNRRLFPVLLTGLITLCMSATVFLNFSWKDNAMMAVSMVKDFPDYPVGYLHAGIAYYDAGMFDKTEELLLKGIDKGLNDPRAYYLLGLCTLSEPEVSNAYFKRSIAIFPKFLYSYIGLGRNCLFENQLDESLAYLYTSLDISPRWNAYGYLIQAHWLRDEKDRAREVFEHSQRNLDPVRALWLEKMYRSLEKNEIQLPLDLGI